MDIDITGSLGLEDVESDPNYLPPKTDFPGEVVKSEYVKPRNKEHLSHVITYKVVDEGSKWNGKEQAEWFRLGIPQYDDEQRLVGVENTMSEQAKSFYRRRLESLGVPENRFKGFKPGNLVALKVTFSVRHANGYQNIANVELPQEPTTSAEAFGNAAAGSNEQSGNAEAPATNENTGTPGEL